MHVTRPTLTQSRTIRVPERYCLLTSLRGLRNGSGDPTVTVSEAAFWWARRTADGPATLYLRRDGDRVHATTWGTGAERTLGGLPALLGEADDPADLVPAPHHQVLDRAARTGKLRLPSTGQVSDHLVQTILEQKVTARGAHRSWTALVRRHGEAAPGPADVPVRLPPAIEQLAELPYHRWHPLGVERRRAETVARACRHIHRLDEATQDGPTILDQRLRAVRGIGPWTAAILLRTVLGDADAVEVGDWNLPHLVTYNLAGERRGDDARMLELLERYRGHRGRVVMLLRIAGARPPRRTHRREIRDIRAI